MSIFPMKKSDRETLVFKFIETKVQEFCHREMRTVKMRIVQWEALEACILTPPWLDICFLDFW